MPHQCVRCNKFYDDGAQEILSGCTCGARLFFYIKKKQVDDARKLVMNLTDVQKKEIERDVFELVDANPDEDDPVVLDFESISVMKPGKYEIDLVHLFKKEPLVFKVGEGKYVIDINETFKQAGKEKR